MRRSIQLVLVAAISTLTGTWLWAQTPTKAPLDAQLSTPFDAPADVKTPVPEGAKAPGGPAAKPAEFASSPPLATATVEAINLRNQFIELSKKKALLMKEPQLKREIGALERDIPELEAWARAEEAVQILRDVIEKHPNTGAAESAKAAIQLIEGQGKDKFRREGIVPSPIEDPQPIFDRPRNRQFVPKPDKPADFNS
jgi:ribosomal protein L31E